MLISTGVEAAGACDSGTLALVMSWGAVVESAEVVGGSGDCVVAMLARSLHPPE